MTEGKLDRRSLLKTGAVVAGAAWAAPMVLSSPAGAQTGTCLGCGGGIAIPFPTDWTHSTDGAFQGPDTGLIGYQSSPPSDYAPYISGPIHFVEQDPTTMDSEAYYTIPVEMQCGATYTFDCTYVWRMHGTHTRTQSLHMEAAPSPTGPWTSSTVLTTSLSEPVGFYPGASNASTQLAYTPTVAGTHYFRYRHSFNGAAGGQIVGNDIAVNAPTVTCTAA